MRENIFYNIPLVYAAKHKDDNERLNSQSGAMFAALSDIVLENGGIVFGCIFNNQYEAIHVGTDCKEGRDAMRYSKYVQSDLTYVFKAVISELKSGRTVLFSGTSCQIAGLKKFIEQIAGNRLEENLYTVDIVCHGVPSPLVWKDYLDWEKKKKKSDICGIICRNKKKYGWKSHVTTISFVNGKKTDSRVFPKIFYGHNILRPACYQCPYKSISHPADITIADYWGIEKALPDFKDDKGVSLVLINNDKGQKWFTKCAEKLKYEQTNIKDSLQKPLIEPYHMPKNRAQFWQDYRQKDFDFIAKTYGNYNFYKNLKWKIRYWIKRNFGI